MLRDPRVERVARRLDQALPAAARRRLRAVRERLGSVPRRPRVTVVVTASDEDAEYVEEALTSLRQQTYPRLDIVLSAHGRSARIVEAARRHQGEDWRLRILRGSVAGRGPARNRGAHAARGDYLVFVQGDDVVPPRGVDRLVSALEVSGSDLAVGRLAIGRTIHDSVLDPYEPAHERTQLHTTLEDSPLAITDVGVGNRMFRTSFWRESGLEFADFESGDAELALTAYLRASAFDLLSQPTYTAMNRGHGTPLDQLYDAAADLYRWIEGQDATEKRLSGLGSQQLRDSWYLGVLDLAIVRYLDDVERADDAQWAALLDYARRLSDAISPEVWTRVRSENRVKLWLLLHDRREELEQFVALRWFERENRPTELRDGTVYAVLPFFGDREVGVPDEQFVMHEAETPLRTILRTVRWVDATTIELDLLTRIDQVDGAGERPHLAVSLVGPGSDDRISLPVRSRTDDQANLTIGHKYQDYSVGGFTAVVDAAALVRASTEPASAGPILWHVEITSRQRGLTRTGSVLARDERGAVGMLTTHHFAPRVFAGRRVNITPDRDAGICLAVLPVTATCLMTAEVVGDRVTGRLDSAGVGLRTLVARHVTGVTARSRLEPCGTEYGFRLELPRVKRLARRGQTRGYWTLRAIASDGAEHAIAWPGSVGEPWLGVGGGRVVISVNTVGNVELVDSSDLLLLDEVENAPGAILIRGRWLGSRPNEVDIRLDGKRASLVAEVSRDVGPGGFEASFPIRCDEWGLGESVIPTGEYHFSLTCGGAKREGQIWLGPKLVDTLAQFRTGDDVRVRPTKRGAEASGLVVLPPLEPEAWGPLGQHVLQQWSQADAGPIDEHAVYLQAYAGATATDSPLALHEELHRRRPDLRLYWGIADHSSQVPEGGIPVLMRTREWYRVLATAKYVVSNIDLDRWFVKRPGQVVVQTFHGYPAKSMGIRMWEAKNFTPRRIERELERTSRDWDLILTPAPEMDVHYRREYRYDGAILNQGYPRDDALVLPGRDETRRVTRRRLGIAPGQVAVLYAPTWRDDLATNYRSARLIQHLDLESAANQLGPDYVFLMRGHRFHASGSDREPGSARLIDVTDYPEVNDLMLASDAAVLDYSSLRFDFALTGRPMVFLVPDLASYTGGVRGFLFDYADTAPGPLLENADAVIEALADLRSLGSEYGPAIAAFNKKYQYLQDGNAAARLATAMLELGEQEPAP